MHPFKVSDGGVHSHITHLEALLEAAKQAQVPQAFVHFFSDGRDTAPISGGQKRQNVHILIDISFTVTYVDSLCTFMSKLGYGKMATLMGRYYAMDRDKRYERTKLAFEGITQGKGEEVPIGDLIKVSSMIPLLVKILLRKCKNAIMQKVMQSRQTNL